MNPASFIVASFLRTAGWPQWRGFLRKNSMVSAKAADMALQALVEIGAGLGATNPTKGVAALATVFVTIDWRTQAVAFVNGLAVTAQESSGVLVGYFPLFERTSAVKARAEEVAWEAVGRHKPTFALLFGRAVIWGNQNQERLERALNLQRANWQPTAGDMRKVGLDIPGAFPYATNQAFYDHCNGVLDDFVANSGPLRSAPSELVAELLGRRA